MMKKDILIRRGFVVCIIIFFMSMSNLITIAKIPMNGAVNKPILPNNVFEEARWAANITDKNFRGWLQYTIEKGIAGRIIKITGTWGTDDGNFSGDFVLKNFIFLKFYRTYRGVFLAEVSGEDYSIRSIGFFRNDWEVGYWKAIIPTKMQVQIVHIPFN